MKLRHLSLLAVVAPTLAVLPTAGPAGAARADSPAAAYAVSQWSSPSGPVLPDRPYAAVEVTYHATYGITLDGGVVSAVDNHKPELTAPSFDRPIVDLTASDRFGIALDDGGHLHTWGAAPAIPETDEAQTYRDVAAGSTHAIGVTTDGELRFWGTAPFNEFDFDPAALASSTIVSVETTSSGSVALTSEGQVLAAGGMVTSLWNPAFAFPADRADEKVTVVDLGQNSAVALTEDGAIIPFGPNNWGEHDVPALPEGRHAVAVSAGMGKVAAVLDDGSVLGWGTGENGPYVERAGARAVDIDLEYYRTAVTYATVASTAAPTIDTHAPIFGDTLTVTPGAWNETPDDVHYQWTAHDADGVPTDVGTDAPSYTPTAEQAEAGVRLSVTVTATKDGYVSGTATSEQTERVSRARFTRPEALAVEGEATVGETLRAAAGPITPTPDSTEWEWYASEDDSGPSQRYRRIEGATTAELTLTPDLAGAEVYATLWIHKAGYWEANVQSLDIPVAPGTLTAPTVEVTGTPRVGQTLTAVATGDPAATGTSYQWLRGSTPIAGATAPTYTPTAADLGQGLAVRTTSTADGYNDATVTSTPTTAIEPGTLDVPAAKVTGKPRVGQLLTATVTGDPAATGTAYQWLRGSAPIAGATARTYKPVAADVGKRLAVRVTSTATGYDAASATSSPTAAVQLGAARLKVTVPAKAKVGTKATIKVTGLARDERFTVTIAGTRTTATADGAGVGTVRVKVTGKTGARPVTVVGSLPDRTGKATLRVVKK